MERIRDDEAYEGVRGRVEARLGDVRVPPQIDVLPISVPSLRERVDDIPLLVEYFVGRFAKEAGKSIRRIGKDTLEQLQAYDWPGNIRELQNVVERAVILSESDAFVVDNSWLKSESVESSEKTGSLGSGRS